jgi:hypothetical protein
MNEILKSQNPYKKINEKSYSKSSLTSNITNFNGRNEININEIIYIICLL